MMGYDDALNKESSDEESDSDSPTRLDGNLKYRVDEGGWLGKCKFKFSMSGRCLSLRYNNQSYHRATFDDPRNGEADGIYFYRTLPEAESESYPGLKDLWERVRVWPEGPYTTVEIRRSGDHYHYGEWGLIERFDI